MRYQNLILAAALSAACGAATARAAFVVEAHFSGKENATNFAILPGAGNATGATAAVPSMALGLAGTNSIFGSNNTVPGVVDTYQFLYTPTPDVDNTVFAPLTYLGNSSAVDTDQAGLLPPNYVTAPQLATGLAGGGTGYYKVYFTTPASANVNLAGSRFDITSDLGTTTLNPVNLNSGGTGPDEVPLGLHTGGANNRWLHIGTVHLTAGNTYTVTETSNVDAFVSQRAHGVMWEFVGATLPTSATIDFTGGTATFGGGGTGVTNNSATYSDVDYYEEDGFRFDYIGDPSNQYVGDYYGASQDSLHGHFLSGFGLTEMRASKIDGGSFDLDSFLLTTNTKNGGGSADGSELSYINASYDGSTIGYSQLLPPENWGRNEATLITLGSEFDNIKYFSITSAPDVFCIGIDDVVVAVVPEPVSVVLLLFGLFGSAFSRRSRSKC